MRVSHCRGATGTPESLATVAQPEGDREISIQSVPRPRPPFERIALLLQGGGALGSYQAGVYQALAEADLHPDWIAGISIGAINSALKEWLERKRA